MRLILKSLFGPSFFLAALLVAANACAEVVVVVSAKSSVIHLSAEQVTKIFLGKTGTFPNGINAEPIDQAEGSSVRDEFYSKIANKSPAQMSAYWTRMMYTGDKFPPEQKDGDIATRKAVARNPNAIGYIEKNMVDNSVRVILDR